MCEWPSACSVGPVLADGCALWWLLIILWPVLCFLEQHSPGLSCTFASPILESVVSLRAVILLIENGIYIYGVYKPNLLPKWQYYWCNAAPRSSQWIELGNLQAYGCVRACTDIYIYIYLCICQWIYPPITYLCIYLFHIYVEAVLACLPDGDVCLSIVQ